MLLQGDWSIYKGEMILQPLLTTLIPLTPLRMYSRHSKRFRVAIRLVHYSDAEGTEIRQKEVKWVPYVQNMLTDW